MPRASKRSPASSAGSPAPQRRTRARPEDAPQRYIAFLRAINVGKHMVRMERLRALFEALGFANVATFIASGNVIFDADSTDVAALEARIERHLERELGYAVATFLRTPQELTRIVSFEPFPAAALKDAHSLYVAFLSTEPSADAQRKLSGYSTDVDQLRVHGREAYWLSRTGMGQSPFSGALLEKTVGRATLRNINTVRRLAAKYDPTAA